MKLEKKSVSIIVPTLNEEGNVRTLVKRIARSLSDSDFFGEIIFIDDNSSDGTRKIVTEIKKEYQEILPIKFFLKKGKPGKAYSIIEGFDYVENDIVAMIDADLQYPPETIIKMAEKIEQGADIVVANRVQKETSFLRSFLSRSFKFVFANLLHDLNCDVQSGLKVFRRKITKEVKLNPSPWTFDLEFLLSAKNYGYIIDSVNIRFDERVTGESKINVLEAAFEIGWNAILLKIRGSAPLLIEAESNLHMRGAGVKHAGQHFITHTTLHHDISALSTFSLWQKSFMFFVLAITVFGLFVNPLLTGIIFLAGMSVLYFIDVVFNLVLVLRSLINPPEIISTKKELLAIDDSKLPVYSIFCPLYKEAHILPHFVKAIKKMEWPKDKLEVLLLLEDDDQETVQSAKKMNLPDFIKIIVVPHSFPKTKPKACNYGISHAKGEYIVIYDAEDVPDPWQLKKAFLGFQKSASNVLCLQAKLNYFNPDQNILTRLFTAEYSLWFDISLPGLQSINTSIPLGGTSNHFRTKDLVELKGWDPFNVTEDCDLGIRLFAKGFRTAIIDSVTLEEANSNFKNWLRQRSRWVKGYMQTYLVHMRNPFQFFKKNGWHALMFQLVVGGKISFMIINPILWITTIVYFSSNEHVGGIIRSLFPTWVFYIAIVSLVFGNFLFIFYYMIGCAKRGHYQIIKYVFFVPIYWIMVSIAAVIATYQLFVKPHYWEKTNHGLHLIPTKSTERKRKIVEFLEKNYIYKKITNLGSIFSVVCKPCIENKISKGDLEKASSLESSNSSFEKIIGRINEKVGLLKNKKMRLFLQEIVKFSLSSKGILLIAMVVGNVVNFAFNAFLTRKLSYSELGLIVFVTTLWYVATIFIGGVSATINHRVSFLVARGKEGKARSFFKRTVMDGLYFIAFIIIVLILLSPVLSKFFQINNAWVLVLFAPAILFGFLSSSFDGFLRGNLFFGLVAVIFISEPFFKFLFAMLFVFTGNSNLTYLSIPLSLASVAVIGALFVYKVTKKQEIKETGRELYFPFHFFLSSILATLSYIIFLSVDIILVKHFFSEEIAGKYSIIALSGKMVYFLATLPMVFLVTFVSRKEGLKQSSKKVFYITLASVASLAGLGVVIFGFLGFFTSPLLFGEKATTIVRWLPMYCLAVGIFAISNTIVTYHLAKKQYIFSYISLIASFVLVGVIWFFHEDISTVIKAFLFVSLFNLFVLGVIHYFESRIPFLKRSVRDFLGIFVNGLPKIEPKTGTSKRILIFNWRDTTHSFAGGAETYIHEIAKNWIKEGNHVTIFCGNDGKQKRADVIDGVAIVRRGGFYLVYFWAFLYYIFRFRGKYDLVIDCENGIPFFTPLYVRKPIFAVLHHVHQDVFFHSLSKPLALLASFLEKDLMPLVYRNVKFITVSGSSKRAMQKIGIGKAGIEIVHNGVNLDEFVVGDKSPRPMVLYLGRLRAYKSVNVLIHAFKKVLKKNKKAFLVIAGSGDFEKYLKSLVKKMGFKPEQIIFMGRVSDEERVELMQSAWVLVNPSLAEGWGVVVIEANACGTAVVASNVSGLRDSVRNGESGCLVPYGNADKFAEKILYIIENKEYRDKMNIAARKWAENFNWERSSNKFFTIIKNVI